MVHNTQGDVLWGNRGGNVSQHAQQRKSLTPAKVDGECEPSQCLRRLGGPHGIVLLCTLDGAVVFVSGVACLRAQIFVM